MAGLAACRVLIAQGKPVEASARLTRALDAVERAGRSGTAIEIFILRCLAHLLQGNTHEAEADLERALALAEPEGYLRVFVDEGKPLAALLRNLAIRRVRMGERSGCSAEYLAGLLAAFGDQDSSESSVGSAWSDAPATPSPGRRVWGERRSARPATLVEPLSVRELEVLRLLSTGLTNEQIARRLSIALGTAKSHVHNVTSKLGAQNRGQTVARARELSLL